jgi:mannose/fructose/N-acetylgalactosamine-specific phosphotransferase system component IID
VYLVAIGWLYVSMMMAVAEATSTQGTVLGALVTFVLYGVLPVSLVMYLLATPARKRAIRAREAAEWEAQKAAQAAAATVAAAATAATASAEPDADGKPAADAVAAVRKEP